jgi:hypothetical protein
MTASVRTVTRGLLAALAACTTPVPPAAPLPALADAAWSPPGAHRFASGALSSGDAISATFASDGRSIYFVKTGRLRSGTRLMTARLDGSAWTAPTPAPFGDATATEANPFVAPDGAVYFASTRPRAPGDSRSDLDLWVAPPTSTGFGPPQHLGAPIESPALEVAPSVTRDGTLYFTSGRTDPPGIYRAVRHGDGYADPERLPPVINRPGGYTSTPFIAPDESYLLFYFQPVAPAGIGDADLYISWRRGGDWSAPEPLGPEVNTADHGEFAPAVSSDGRYLFFSRNQVRSFEPALDIAWEDIFYVPVARVAALRPPAG